MAAREDHVKRGRRTSGLTAPFSAEDSHEILEELCHLLESRFFKASRRSSEFLSFIVGETLKGRVETLKERFLGAKLFDREIGYDTNADPVVRVTACEVRKRLNRHYEGANRGVIRIVLPVGNYVPKFQVAEKPFRAPENEKGIEPERPVDAAK